MRPRVAAIAGTVAATFAFWAVARWVIYDFPQLGDTRVYQHAVRMMDAGFVPYRDFDIEYPPLATGLFWLIERLPGSPGLAYSFAMCAALAATAVAALLVAGRLGLSRVRTLFAVTVVVLAPALLGTLLQTRYDLLLSACLAWVVVAALARRFGWMWTLAAVATALKLVPLLLVPLLAVWHWRHRGTARTAGALAGFAAVVTATFAPFALIAPTGTWRLFQYHLVRPLQIESLASSVIQALGLPFEQVQSYGSDNIDGAVPALAASLSTLALVACVLGVAATLLRRTSRTARGGDLVAAVAATMLAAVVFGKVVSPQYLAWLLPVALVVPGRRGAVVAGAFTLALPLTQLVFPLLYRDLVERSAHLPVGLLVARNLLLVAALVAAWAGRDARTEGREADARSPVPTTG